MSRYIPSSKEELEPLRLELSLNPENGSLLTTPLTHVLLAVTDGLYRELYDMTHGEVEVVAPGGAEDEEAAAPVGTRMERLSNLSFAQRRHEIAWRLAQHGRGLQHVAALTAAAASSDISQQVRVSSTALQHSRAAWVQADEAQDALYFFHAQLFPVRAAPHDVYGASDVLLEGRWLDLPTDLRITADPYEISRPAEWTKAQLQEEWQMAIREKLLTGEVGWMRRQSGMPEPPWKVAIKGSRVHLTFGKPRQIQNAETRSTATIQETYPLSAWLTVLPIPESDDNETADEEVHTEWFLHTLDVTVQAKTGEFNHQLETSKRQRFTLHRLAALAMTREEQRARQAAKTSAEENGNKALPARPLNALFRLSHTFLLSWQLELLSAQAQALRRGIWAAGDTNPLQVTPTRFFEGQNDAKGLLGVLSISFWKVEDQYGPPTLSDLQEIVTSDSRLEEDDSKVASKKLRAYIPTTNQLVLCIRADTEQGIRVSISGGSAFQATDTPAHSQQVVRELMEAASNPLALSASDALLAATQLCAEQKCRATVHALQDNLPDWIELSLEQCGIVVAADIQYHGIDRAKSKLNQSRPVLFRLGCDARTGSFVNLFSRSMELLRQLAGDDIQASEAMAVRVAKLPSNRRRAARSESSGRIVRGAFESLIRSMNVLGERVGVGGKWDDISEEAASLRQKNIVQACRDVRQALITACGMASLYGIAPLAIGAALGLNALPDMAGKAVTTEVDGISWLKAPPISVMLDQQMKETSSRSLDGVTKKRRYLEQSLFAISCSATSDGVKLVPMVIETMLDSPAAATDRQHVKVVSFRKSTDEETEEPPEKKARLQISNEDDLGTLQEVDILAKIIWSTHDTLEG